MGTHRSAEFRENHGIYWLAGEASGDYIASLVIPEVVARTGGLPQYGMGGDKMRAVGVVTPHDIQELNVRGYVEVIQHLPRLFQLRHNIYTECLEAESKVFVGVDAPDFNLTLEKQLRRKGMPVAHLISPSIWAWRPERIHDVREAVDHMMLVFPFEQEIYQRAGIRATFVGHPLANIIPMTPDTCAARQRLGLDADAKVLTVMPGSRPDEIENCSTIFFDAAERMMKRIGEMKIVVPVMNDQARAKVIFNAGAFARVAKNLVIVMKDSHTAIEAADAVLCASGTAALECALFKKPMVVGYKMPALTGMLMQKKALTHYVSLPNILLNDKVVPEFLQYFCVPDFISYAIEDAVTNDRRRARLVERFSVLHRSLRADTPNLVADIVSDLAKRSRFGM